MQFWDTSTLLKLYVPEPDSALFAAHLRVPNIYASELARWELMRAVARKESEGAIPPQSAEVVFDRFQTDVASQRVVMIPVDAAVETQFRNLILQMHRRLPPVALRTLDAIHLATALLLPASEVVTTDTLMRSATVAAGLKVFP
jgi:hypothetical protein